MLSAVGPEHGKIRRSLLSLRSYFEFNDAPVSGESRLLRARDRDVEQDDP